MASHNAAYISPAPTDAPQSGAGDYDGGFVAPPTYIPTGHGGYTFEEKFIVNKPKYNDIWAGILVILPLFLLSRLSLKMLIVNVFSKVRTGHSGLCSS